MRGEWANLLQVWLVLKRTKQCLSCEKSLVSYYLFLKAYYIVFVWLSSAGQAPWKGKIFPFFGLALTASPNIFISFVLVKYELGLHELAIVLPLQFCQTCHQTRSDMSYLYSSRAFSASCLPPVQWVQSTHSPPRFKQRGTVVSSTQNNNRIHASRVLT